MSLYRFLRYDISMKHIIHRKILFLIVFILLTLIIAILYHFKFLTPFEKWFQLIGKTQNYSYTLGVKVGDWMENTNLDALKKENVDLRGTLINALIDKSQCTILTEENVKLRQSLNFGQANHVQPIIAQVIGVNNRIYHNTLLISQGGDSGITVGNAVFVHDGVLIGKIIDVKEHHATVLLLTDKSSKVASTVQNKNNTIGIVEGELGLSLHLNLIPKTDTVSPNDIVITSGLEDGIPRGLIIGVVKAIETMSNELFDSALIESPVVYEKSTIVSIIVK